MHQQPPKYRSHHGDSTLSEEVAGAKAYTKPGNTLFLFSITHGNLFSAIVEWMG